MSSSKEILSFLIRFFWTQLFMPVSKPASQTLTSFSYRAYSNLWPLSLFVVVQEQQFIGVLLTLDDAAIEVVMVVVNFVPSLNATVVNRLRLKRRRAMKRAIEKIFIIFASRRRKLNSKKKERERRFWFALLISLSSFGSGRCKNVRPSARPCVRPRLKS